MDRFLKAFESRIVFAFGRRIDPDRTYYKGYLNKEGKKRNVGDNLL